MALSLDQTMNEFGKQYPHLFGGSPLHTPTHTHTPLSYPGIMHFHATSNHLFFELLLTHSILLNNQLLNRYASIPTLCSLPTEIVFYFFKKVSDLTVQIIKQQPMVTEKPCCPHPFVQGHSFINLKFT